MKFLGGGANDQHVFWIWKGNFIKIADLSFFKEKQVIRTKSANFFAEICSYPQHLKFFCRHTLYPAYYVTSIHKSNRSTLKKKWHRKISVELITLEIFRINRVFFGSPRSVCRLRSSKMMIVFNHTSERSMKNSVTFISAASVRRDKRAQKGKIRSIQRLWYSFWVATETNAESNDTPKCTTSEIVRSEAPSAATT